MLLLAAVAVVAPVAVAAPPAKPSAKPPGKPTPKPAPRSSTNFGSSVTVREVEVPFSPGGAVLVGPEDVAVRLDGTRQEVLRVLGTDQVLERGWSIVVYVDRALADPATVTAGVAALARLAPALTTLGRVELRVAAPWPQAVGEASRDSSVVKTRLENLAGRAPSAESGTGWGRKISESGAIRQLDRLLVDTAALDRDGPKLLVLVAGDLPFSPHALEAGWDRRAPAKGAQETLAAAFGDTARTLAASGWTVLVVPRWKEHEKTAPTDRFLDLSNLLDPSVEAWTRFAAESAGLVAPSSEALERETTELQHRALVAFSSTQEANGALARLEVGPAGAATVWPSPRWQRFASPEGVARARLRLALSESASVLRLAAPQPLPASLSLRVRRAVPEDVALATAGGAQGNEPSDRIATALRSLTFRAVISRMLHDDPAEANLVFRVRPASVAAGAVAGAGAPAIDLALLPSNGEVAGSLWRVSAAVQSGDEIVSLVHANVEAPAGTASSGVDIALPPAPWHHLRLALDVEELASRRFGTSVMEVSDRPR